MTLQDLLVTPIYLILLSLLAWSIRPYITTKATIKYYFPALYLKFFGAISVGMIYQFYYSGGDTFNYFNYGSKWIWEAFKDNPIDGLRMIFSSNNFAPDLFDYWSRIWFYKDDHSYQIVRIAGFFDIFTLHTYSATALFFAFFSFIGLWSAFKGFAAIYPSKIRDLALGFLFMPSVVFWGSGLLKDSITIGALGLLVSSLFNIFLLKRFQVAIYTDCNFCLLANSYHKSLHHDCFFGGGYCLDLFSLCEED